MMVVHPTQEMPLRLVIQPLAPFLFNSHLLEIWEIWEKVTSQGVDDIPGCG